MPMWKPEEDRYLKSMYGTFSSKEIGRALGRPSSTVRNRCVILRLVGVRASGDLRVKHGYNRTEKKDGVRPEYHTWAGMLRRCYAPTDKGYKRYGARGITVDPSWFSFESFIKDMGDKPGRGYWLERIDNNGPYAPWNCKWATPKEQGNNRRGNRVLEFNQRKLTISQWADALGKSRKLIGSRLLAGWSVQDALMLPVGARRVA